MLHIFLFLSIDQLDENIHLALSPVVLDNYGILLQFQSMRSGIVRDMREFDQL